jgi:biotin operon repressor
MRRADRLFQIVQYLRSRRLTVARWLAEQLEVSERTAYRDMRDLMLSGVPIEGEAGVGYALRHKLDLPPLMFDRSELDALKLGARMVAAWGDPAMAKAANLALAKIRSALPDEVSRPQTLPVYAPAIHNYPLAWLAPLRHDRRALCAGTASNAGGIPACNGDIAGPVGIVCRRAGKPSDRNHKDQRQAK